MITQIFLDLDGVVVDWCNAAIIRLGLDLREKDIKRYDTIEITYRITTGNLSRTKFFSHFDEDFWLGLRMYPWAKDLLELLDPYSPTILTAPTLNSAGWRQSWIRKNLPQFVRNRRYLIGPAKSSVAHQGALLIDDKIENCETFKAAGGHAILFPQPWNTNEIDNGRRYDLFKSAFLVLESKVGIQIRN